MRQRIETGRARTYASSRALVTITLGLAVGLLVFSPKFMAPYRTFTGQLVLTGIGAVFAAALAGLVVMSRPAPTPYISSHGHPKAARQQEAEPRSSARGSEVAAARLAHPRYR